MRQIRSGEEVNYRGERWVVSRIDPARAASYRLLRTDRDGHVVEWTAPQNLSRIDSYVRSVEDTARA